MGISINTNVAATKSGFYLANNHQALQKSMDRFLAEGELPNRQMMQGALLSQ